MFSLSFRNHLPYSVGGEGLVGDMVGQYFGTTGTSSWVEGASRVAVWWVMTRGWAPG
jgi:hypothetical protein